MSRILIVDDEFLIRYTLEEGLRDRGHETQSAENVEEGLLKARKFHPDVVLLDNLLEHSVGMDEIATFKAADPQIQVILMTAYGSVSQAVEAVKRGAYDYILKPFDIDDIEMAVKRSVEKTRNQESLEYLKGESQEFLGVSQAVQQIRRHIEILGENSSVNVLIRGETGTGKEVAARLIHDISGRPGLMVRINCGAIPENLLENELFGYERGAFAGAMRTKKGLIEMADGGTVFFDEVGEMPLAMQAKLLTFLDDRKIKRVGGLEDIEVDVRIIAATNRNLEKAVEQGLFTQAELDRIMFAPMEEQFGAYWKQETSLESQLWYALIFLWQWEAMRERCLVYEQDPVEYRQEIFKAYRQAQGLSRRREWRKKLDMAARRFGLR